jgi:hypothetical protein
MKRPPVEYANQQQPWGTPSWQPPFPQSLPRPKGRSSAPGAGGISEVRNDHNYANVIDIAVPVGITSLRVLDQPTGLRNLLMFRNSSATQTIFIGFGKDATTESTLAILAGQTVLFDFVVPQEDIFALASAAGGTLSLAYSTIPEV